MKDSESPTSASPVRDLVLLAEDNEETAELTRKMLELFGYRVSLARNGVEAVAKAIAELPDIIVMDIHMPVMDGLQAASQIRKEPRTQLIPILAATARAMAGDKEKCLASGCSDYIAKPYTHRQLIASIKQLLKTAV